MSVTDNLTELQRQWDIPVVPEASETLDTFFKTLATQLYHVDIDIQETKEDGFLTTAKGEELDLLAAPFNVQRRTGESDDTFRQRVAARIVALRSTGTYGDIATTLRVILGTDTFNVAAAEEVGAGTIRVEVPSDVIADAPLDVSDIETELTRSLPPTHTATVVTSDTFVFAGTDTGGGFDEGVWGQ